MLDLDPVLRIGLCSLLWCGVVIAVFHISLQSRHSSAGLPLALILSISFLHCGALVHLSPDYDHYANAYLASWLYTKETVAAGFEVSVLGVMGMAAGMWLANGSIRVQVRPAFTPSPGLNATASKGLIAFGLGATALQIFAGSSVASLPGVTALLGGFNNLFLLGICGLILHFTMLRKMGYVVFAICSGASAILGVQMLATGILGDSVAAAITVISFALIIFRPRSGSISRSILGLMVSSSALLIAGVCWLEIRQEVRTAVWHGASLSDRLDASFDAMSKVKVFDDSSQTRLEYIDMRMNHNVTIGKAFEHLTAFPNRYARGDTLLSAALGWVPRALWPNKPERGGSEMVSTYTRNQFAHSSSFGTGPIFEFYINFGLVGVTFGCLIFGFTLRLLDIRSARIFADGNVLKVAPYFAAGAAMVAPMNSMFFIVNSAITSAIAGFLMMHLARSWTPRQVRHPTENGSKRV